MRSVVLLLSALLACFVIQAAGGSRAAAQVIISGQVTSYSTTETTAAAPPPSGYVATGGAPEPTRYVHRSAATPALWVPGMIALLGGWAVNLFGIGWIVGPYGISGDAGTWYGYGAIPVLGPWLQFAVDGGNAFPEWSIATGLIQAAGLVLIILGVVITEEWDEPVYTFNEADPHSPTLAFGVSGTPGGGVTDSGAMGTLTLTHF